MRCSDLLAAAAVAGVTAAESTSTNATIVIDNPAGVTYTATLSGHGVDGSVSAIAHAGGTGVVFSVQFSQLPSSGGPFPYHIHQNAVPANGNCSATGGHLDPFASGDAVPCNAAEPQTCQVGDLSGKHGALAINDTTVDKTVFRATYVDLYASTNPAYASFFGNRSVVVHAANLTRLACGNFTRVAAGNTTATPSSSSSPTSSPSSSSSPSSGSSGSGAAAVVVGGGTGRVAGLVVALAVAVAVL